MEISDTYLILIVKAVVTLLPIVPAYVLFRALPSQAEVSGPFQGMTIKLGGAFSAYFIVFLLLLHGLDIAPAVDGIGWLRAGDHPPV